MYRRWRKANLMLAACCCFSWVAHAERVEVQVESGRLAGEKVESIVAFKGVPYAAPPIGKLRWEPPRRPLRWSGVRDASKFGAACPQDPKLGGNPQPVAEDCLLLNIWAPADATRNSAPVMVWIHGGGFVAGAGFQDLYFGDAFARDGVVLVSINYRLGSLGIFAHPALHGGGNFGVMDQIAALQWVKRNIAKFGGDPQRVTVFGESAGGHSVLLLAASRQAEGLFKQAIAQSAPGFRKNPKTRAAQEAADIELAAAAGVPASGTAAQLRALEPEKLFGNYFEAGPFIDGDIVREFPLEAAAAGHLRSIPLIIGSNSDEGSLAKVYPKAVPAILEAMGDDASTVRAAYGEVAEDTPRFERELFGDVIFGAALRRIAHLQSTAAPTYLYKFDYVSTSQRAQRPGAGHVSEVPYVFDTLANWWHPSTDEDRAMAKQMHACWVTFAKTGQPVCGEGDWLPYDRAKDNSFIFTAQGSRSHNGARARQFDAIQAALYPR